MITNTFLISVLCACTSYYMNILLVAGPGITLKEPYESGIEAFIVSFANQLVDEGHKVDVIANEAEASSKFTLINPFNKKTPGGSEVVDLVNEKREFKNLNFKLYDVIHYNMFYPQLLSVGLELNKISFLTLHSPADEKRIAAYKKVSGRSNLVFVSISERIKQQWDKALGIDTALIPNGINLDLWSTMGSENRDYLLWSARINEQKNVAAAICLAKNMQLPLKIAGRITDQQYFAEMVKPHLNEQIQYVGHVTQRELGMLAKGASAYLATATWQEPFGLSALEMLASGVPVVGFKNAVPPEWDHESVLTTASVHWQDLVKLVKKCTAISSEACKDFASNMSIQNMTTKYVKLYEDVLLPEADLEETRIADEGILRVAAQQQNTLNKPGL